MPDSDDFENLLTTYMNDMYTLALQLTGSKDNAEDLVQDLFVSLSMKRYTKRTIHRPKAWLASILYRIFIDQWRRKVKGPVQYGLQVNNEHDTDIEAICNGPGPLEALEYESEQARAQSALDTLNERQKQILILHDLEGYTLKEITEIMTIPIGTAKSNLHRAREKIQQVLTASTEKLGVDATIHETKR